jgi:acyl carrier protein
MVDFGLVFTGQGSRTPGHFSGSLTGRSYPIGIEWLCGRINPHWEAVLKQTPGGQAGRPEDVAAVVFPTSEEAGHIACRILLSQRRSLYLSARREAFATPAGAGIIFIKEEGYMTLEEKVISIITEQLDVTREECIPAASFIDDLGADSLDLVELIMEMEETFDIQIADTELEKIRTIKDVLDYLKNRGVVWHE